MSLGRSQFEPQAFTEEEADPDISQHEPVPSAIDRVLDVMTRPSTGPRSRSINLSEANGEIEHYEESARDACDATKDYIERMAKEVASKLPGGVDEAISDFLAFTQAAIRQSRGPPDHPVTAEDFEGYLNRAQAVCREVGKNLDTAVSSRDPSRKREILQKVRDRLKGVDEILRELDAIVAEKIQGGN